MSETFVIDIANANAVSNKIATTLNRAGSSPTNPILKGLGTALNIKFSPDVIDFTVLFGRESPAEERGLSLTEIDNNHYRLRARAGEGVLGFTVPYTNAQRHFVRINMATAGQLQGTERELWIQEDPLITAFLCSAQFAWCDEAAAQYYELSPSGACATGEGFDAALNNDPGPPPTGTLQDGDFKNFIVQGAAGDVAQVELGPERVVQFGIYGTGTPEVPIVIPISIMDNWRDEFNIKHYGGARYVSIFESDLSEEVQGTLVTNRFQEDITTVTDLSILTVNPDIDYTLTFRFRSELNDPYYVDKQVRFRVVTADMLTRAVTRVPNIDDAPVPVYDEATGDFLWDNEDIFINYGPFSVVEAWVIKGNEKVSLPTDDVTPFPVDWFDHRTIIHGGQITVQFRRETFFFTEVLNVTYDVRRPNGSYELPIEVVKNFGRQTSLVGATSNFTPDTQFRLIRSTTPGEPVYLEVLNVQTRHTAAIFWTDLGSLQLDVPLKSGARFDVTSLFTFDGPSIVQGVFNVALVTDHQMSLYQQKPVAVREWPIARTPAIDASGPASDFVYPIVTPDYPNVTIEWPALTDQGNAYGIAGYAADPSDPSGGMSRFFIKGRKGILSVDGMVPGGTKVISSGLADIVYPEEGVFELVYSIDHDFEDSVNYVVEKPTWLGYDAVPPPFINSGPLQMLAYDGSAIFTVIPPNFLDISITGNLGTRNFNLNEIIEDQPIDLTSGSWDGTSASVSITYNIYDPVTDSIVSYGPFVIPKFEAMNGLPTTEINLERTLWRPSRLVEWDGRLPMARILQADKLLTFDYTDIPFSRYTRFKVVNPLDQTQIAFFQAPANLLDYDIRRMFRTDTKFRLQPGQGLLVTFLHETGASKTALYKITGDFEDPIVIDDLRGA